MWNKLERKTRRHKENAIKTVYCIRLSSGPLLRLNQCLPFLYLVDVRAQFQKELVKYFRCIYLATRAHHHVLFPWRLYSGAFSYIQIKIECRPFKSSKAQTRFIIFVIFNIEIDQSKIFITVNKFHEPSFHHHHCVFLLLLFIYPLFVNVSFLKEITAPIHFSDTFNGFCSPSVITKVFCEIFLYRACAFL